MKEYKLKFNICRDEEAKKAGEKIPVTVTIQADETAIEKYMQKAAKVWIQSQLRSNWDKFIESGCPEEVTLDVPIFGSTRGVVTQAKATDVLAKAMAEMSMKEKMAYLKKIGLV